MLVVQVLAFMTGLTVLTTALLNLRQSRRNSTDIAAVRVLVNGRLDEALKYIKRLEVGGAKEP